MALTNTQYDTIIREYNKKQLQNRRDQEARIALAEKELPELSQINGEIASLSMKCARRLLEGEAASIDDLKTEIRYPPQSFAEKCRIPGRFSGNALFLPGLQRHRLYRK